MTDMKKILYNLGLLLLGLSIYSITWTFIEWSFIGVLQRMLFLMMGTILIYKCG